MSIRRPEKHDPAEREFRERYRGQLDGLRIAASVCPHPDLISAALMNVLPNDQRDAVLAHVAGCRLCAALKEGSESASEDFAVEGDRLEIVRNSIDRRRAPKPRLARQGVYVLAGVFAAVLVVLVSVSTFSTRISQENSGSPATTPPAPITIARVLILPLEKAPLKLPLDSLMWRGDSDPSGDQYLKELGLALQSYNQDRFDEVIEPLRSLGQKYPSAEEPPFYEGVALLFLSRPADARVALELARSRTGPTLAADIDWYLAVANEMEGRVEEASQVLERLCAGESSFRNRACNFRSALRTK